MTLVQQTVARQESVMGSASDCSCVLQEMPCIRLEKEEEELFIVSLLYLLIYVITCFCNWNQDTGRYPLACL